MKILIVKLSAIGDVIMSLSMLTEIERLYPEAKITWVCGKTVAPLLKTFKQIDELIVIQDSKLTAKNKASRALVVLGLWRKLSGRSYDLAIVGHGDPAYKLLVKPVKYSEIRVFNRDTTDRHWPIMARHHCDEHARLISMVDDFSMTEGEFPDVSHLKQTKRTNAARPLLAIAPGGASTSRTEFQHRRWPLPMYVELAERLVALNYDVVISGGPDDEWCSSSFSHLNVQNTIGKTSIVDQIGLYSTYDLLVAHDSGPMHMASLVGTPVVSLFGPTIPSRTQPRSPGSVVLWGGENLACRPCYDGRTYAPCSRNLCLEQVTVDQVAEAVGEVLGLSSGTPVKTP